ncbi:hypothetical protein ABIE56_002396 [Luteibacter sp. 621]
MRELPILFSALMVPHFGYTSHHHSANCAQYILIAEP